MAVEAPKKPTKKATGKGAPPVVIDTPNHGPTDKPAGNELVPFNFAVTAELRKEFKLAATMHDMSMVAVLKESFELFKKSKGMQ